MKTYKILLLIIILISFLNCNSSNKGKNRHIYNDAKETTSIKITLDKDTVSTDRECFIKLSQINDSENIIAIFDDFSLQVISTDSEKITTDLLYENSKKTIIYKTDVILDMGELNYWGYELNNDFIYLLELDNYYSSVFFIFLKQGNNMYSLGNIITDESKIENEGKKEKSFQFCYYNSKELHVKSYLNNTLQKSKRIRILNRDIIPKEIKFKNLNTIVYPQVETYLNIRSAPNIKSSEILCKAYPKDALLIIDTLEGWSKIKFKSKVGFVSNDFID